jgi:hypothetical protein
VLGSRPAGRPRRRAAQGRRHRTPEQAIPRRIRRSLRPPARDARQPAAGHGRPRTDALKARTAPRRRPPHHRHDSPTSRVVSARAQHPNTPGRAAVTPPPNPHGHRSSAHRTPYRRESPPHGRPSHPPATRHIPPQSRGNPTAGGRSHRGPSQTTAGQRRPSHPAATRHNSTATPWQLHRRRSQPPGSVADRRASHRDPSQLGRDPVATHRRPAQAPRPVATTAGRRAHGDRYAATATPRTASAPPPDVSAPLCHVFRSHASAAPYRPATTAAPRAASAARRPFPPRPATPSAARPGRALPPRHRRSPHHGLAVWLAVPHATSRVLPRRSDAPARPAYAACRWPAVRCLPWPPKALPCRAPSMISARP